MTAVSMDPQSAGTLEQARSDALASLKQSMPNYTPLQAPARPAQSAAVQGIPQGSPPEVSAAPQEPTDEAIEGNEGSLPGIPEGVQAPQQPSDKAVSDTEDNTEMLNVSTAMHFLRDSFKGTGAEIATAVPRALLRLGGWLTNAAAGGIFLGEKAFGSNKHYEDAQFDFIKHYIDPAIARWTPDRAQNTGQGPGSGGGAQAIGNAAEMAPGIATGGAGVLAQVLQQSTDSAMNDIDQGKSIKHAIADGTIDGVSTWLISKLGVSPSKSLVQRVIKSAGVGGVVQMAANVAKAGISKVFGDPNAPTPDLLEGVDQATILGGLFGVKRHAGLDQGPAVSERPPAESAAGSSTPQGAAPSAKPSSGSAEPNIPAAPTPEAVAATPVPTPTQPTGVPDRPTVEPQADIKAQFADMNNKLTPRVGVLVTPDSQTHLSTLGDKTVDQAKSQGRTIDLPQGTLVLKTKGDVIKVNNRLKSGEDPQAVIGSVTGAGIGKSSDATTVVQGRDASGNVATETTVSPTDVPMAVQKAEDQGYRPVVTTPQEAISRRIAGANAELSTADNTGKVPATVRYYHGGNPEGVTGPLWFTTSQQDAEGWAARAPGMNVYHVDVPENHPARGEGDLANGIPYPSRVELPPELANKRQLTKAQPAARTPVATPEALPEHESNETPAEPVQRMGLFKTGTGKEVPVHIEEGAPQGQLRVRPIGTKTGEAADRTIDVPAERVRQSTREPPATVEKPAQKQAHISQKAEPEKPATVAEVQAEPKTEAPRNENPPILNREKPAAAVAQPAEVTSARAPKSALESLPEALATHIKQETPGFERKNAAPLAERQDNASAFAAVLGKAAEESRGKVSDDVVRRASNAAKSAIGLTLKSKNATDKGQGTSHARVSATVDEMHRAARDLLGIATEADKQPAVAPKAAALKARIEQRKAVTEESAKKQVKVVKKSAEDVLSTAERLKTNKLASEMIAADFDEYPKAHEKLLAHLHQLADAHDDFPRGQIDQYMHFLMDQREQAHEGRTGRMSDTLEPEEHEFEKPEEGFSNTYRPNLDVSPGGKARTTAGRNWLQGEWEAATRRTASSGFFESLNKFKNTGEPLGAHFLLDKLIANTQTPTLRTLLTNVRSRVPDSPVYNTDNLTNMKTGAPLGSAKAAGYYHMATNSIQYNFRSDGNRPTQLRGLFHEMIHAGTLTELAMNPHGELAMKMNNALDILRQRLARRYGEDTIHAWTSFFQDKTGRVQKPEGESLWHLYGMTNSHEMASEVLANPEFIREVAESEDYADPRTEQFGQKETLLSRVFKAIGHLFGIKDPNLLQHIVDTTFDTMEAQAQRRPDIYGKHYSAMHAELDPYIQKALQGNPLEQATLSHAFNLIDEPAPPIRGASQRIATIDEGSGLEPTAREFVHVFGSKAIDGLRKTVVAFKTVGQLYRDHMKDFGHDDATNPLRSLQESDIHKQNIMSKLREITAPVAQKWMRLSREDDQAVSKLMIDTTMYKLDPRLEFDKQSVTAQAPKGAEERLRQFKDRYDKLSSAAREVYSEATDANRKLLRAQRRAGVDTAISALDADLSEAQRGLLYGARSSEAYDSLIGKGKLIDIGESNEKLKSALSDFSGFSEIDGPYHHLGRQGDYVVQAEPSGTREFDTRAAADEFARTVKGLSPGSRAKVADRGGKFAVDFKSQYVSMHESRREAEQERDRLDKLNLNPGKVTQKTLGNAYGALSHGMQELVTEAERKIQKNGSDEGTRALVDSLRSAFLQMSAARSAYAGSRLARKNYGGVKPRDMRRNFAEHALSAGWHTAQMQTAFERAESMAKLRNLARDAHDEASQGITYRRGQVVDALNKHTANEVSTFGQKAPFNAMLAKLGFMSYLASPSHAAIWMTQNFTTGIPVAGARWGYGKALSSFRQAMSAVVAPSVRAQMKAAMGRTASSEEVHQILLDAMAKHPVFGKWATGPNSHLRQLFDRGVISHSYADELGSMAEGPSNLGRAVPGYDRTIERVFGWARVLPAMADSVNRLSTALAGLEMTGGDIRKTSDFVQEIHADYSAQNKPLAFKRLSGLPGGNSITMFKTYVQEMSHLLYSNLIGTFHGENRSEAAKTLAGLVVGNALFAGVASAVGIEPLRLALYAYHKVADEEGDVWDFRNAVHRFLNEHFGKTAGDLLAGGPLTRVFNVDVSSRMGLSDLFFHNPPDLLSADKDAWKNFFFDELGPMPQELAGNVTSFYGKAQRGDIGGAISSVIPIKQWQDAAKALQLLEAGKQDSLGGQLTQPSAADAITQLLGFKPADVATAQEKQGVKIEYALAARQARTDIVKQLVTASTKGEQAAAWGRLERWNRNNPTVPVRTQDIQRAMQAQIRTTEGVPERNEKAEAATNF